MIRLMTFTIRKPVLADAETLAALHVATWREAYAHLLPDEFFTEAFIQGRLDMWQHVLGNPRDEWVVRIAESEGTMIGFAFVGQSLPAEGQVPPQDRQLYSIYVSAAHYSSGVGQALLDAVLGDQAAMLWVAKDNPRAVAFYLRNGFAFDGAEQIDPAAPKIIDARMVRSSVG